MYTKLDLKRWDKSAIDKNSSPLLVNATSEK